MNPAWNILDPASPSPVRERQLAINRRQLFGRAATGIGAAALASMLGCETGRAEGSAGLPNVAPRAKRVIYLFQNGGPTHVDLFDYKPELSRIHGQPVPAEYLQGKRFSTMTGDPSGKLMLQPVEPYRQYGGKRRVGERSHAPHRRHRR